MEKIPFAPCDCRTGKAKGQKRRPECSLRQGIAESVLLSRVLTRPGEVAATETVVNRWPYRWIKMNGSLRYTALSYFCRSNRRRPVTPVGNNQSAGARIFVPLNWHISSSRISSIPRAYPGENRRQFRTDLTLSLKFDALLTKRLTTHTLRLLPPCRAASF